MKLAISRQLSAFRLFISVGFCLFVFLYALPLILTPTFAEIGIKQPAVNGGIQAGSNSGASVLGSLIKNFIAIVYLIASIGVLIMFLIGTLQWIFSGGDKEKVASARKRITTALIGLVLLSLTFVVLGVMSQLTGINILGELTLPKFGAP